MYMDAPKELIPHRHPCVKILCSYIATSEPVPEPTSAPSSHRHDEQTHQESLA